MSERRNSLPEEEIRAPDEVDGGLPSCFRRQDTDDENISEVGWDEAFIISKTKIDDEFYSMEYPYNGYLLIFAHSVFRLAGAEPRPSTKKDISMLKKTFTRLNFTIRVCEDYTFRKMEEVIKEVASMNFEEYASFAIAVSSHGRPDGFCAYDKVYNPEEVLYDPFKHCTTLYGKPKMFFLAPCRGESTDDGVNLLARVETDGEPLEEFVIPREADILMVYATVKDHTAYSNEVYGSQFFIYLTEALDSYAAQQDLLSLLTIANRRLSINFHSSNSKKKELDNKKQCMCIMHTLTRMIKFKIRGSQPNLNSRV